MYVSGRCKTFLDLTVAEFSTSRSTSASNLLRLSGQYNSNVEDTLWHCGVPLNGSDLATLLDHHLPPPSYESLAKSPWTSLELKQYDVLLESSTTPAFRQEIQQLKLLA